MAGTTPTVSREVWLELARRVTADGGKAMPARHDGTKLLYPEASHPKNRDAAERGASTCACGDRRQVMITYQRAVERGDGEMVEMEKRYVACVNCDAVALQPRWFTGKWGNR